MRMLLAIGIVIMLTVPVTRQTTENHLGAAMNPLARVETMAERLTERIDGAGAGTSDVASVGQRDAQAGDAAQSADHAAARDSRAQPRRIARYMPHIRAAAATYDIPVALILAVIEVESAFNPKAVSGEGARGLMQIMPATARGLGVDPARLFEPAVNIDTGTRYLRRLAGRFDRHTIRVLAAYNAGPARVVSDRRLPRETRRYLDKVRDAYKDHARRIAEE